MLLESKVLEILTQVNTTKRAAALEIENSVYTERSKINELKRTMMESNSSSEEDATTEEDTDDETPALPPPPAPARVRERVCPPAPKKRAGPRSRDY